MNQQSPQNQNPSNQPQNDQPSQTPSTTDAALQSLLSILGPVVEFHKSVDNASDNDLRLFWDIRLVQGKDTAFTSMSGHSSFPGVLAGCALGQLPSMMSREIVEKIAVPLAARLQDLTTDKALNAILVEAKPAAPAKPKASEDVDEPPAAKTELSKVMLPDTVVKEAVDIAKEIKKYD